MGDSSRAPPAGMQAVDVFGMLDGDGQRQCHPEMVLVACSTVSHVEFTLDG